MGVSALTGSYADTSGSGTRPRPTSCHRALGRSACGISGTETPGVWRGHWVVASAVAPQRLLVLELLDCMSSRSHWPPMTATAATWTPGQWAHSGAPLPEEQHTTGPLPHRPRAEASRGGSGLGFDSVGAKLHRVRLLGRSLASQIQGQEPTSVPRVEIRAHSRAPRLEVSPSSRRLMSFGRRGGC